MNKNSILLSKRIFILLISIAILLICLLNIITTPTSSPEWIYTVEWLNRVACLAAILACIIYMRSLILAILVVCSVLLFAIPYYAPFYQYNPWQIQYLLSACWALAFILAGVAFFLVAAKFRGVIAGVFCLFGSIIIALGIAEGCLLLTSQPADAIADASSQSIHAKNGVATTEHESWAAGQCGMTPGTPGKESRALHRMRKFDDDLFDVEYNFNSRGWRKLPEGNKDARNDLIIFGCSLTFGYGLEDEQTWAWQLGRFLGPDWRLENYAASAYGANQMLCLLEKRLIEPPSGKTRFALFLGIEDHLIRNEFFSSMPHYQLDASGEARAGGKGKYNWLHLLPVAFNGSQLAREIRNLGMAIKRKYPGTEAELYIAMLKQSSDLLRQNYNTKLIVLLWPDIEELKPQLESLGIPVIMARAMLPEWDKGDVAGSAYYIKYPFEPHPNALASYQLAKGISIYLKNVAEDSIETGLNK